jgi:hypothetical protein
MNKFEIKGDWNIIKDKLIFPLKPMKSHSRQLQLIPLACFAIVGTFTTACSEQTVDEEATEAVSQVEASADEAIEQARESIRETEKLDPGATDQERAVANAVEESAIKAADELEARASEAAAEIRDAVREAAPEAKVKSQLQPQSQPQPTSDPVPEVE